MSRLYTKGKLLRLQKANFLTKVQTLKKLVIQHYLKMYQKYKCCNS